jgi:hypothetical protein
MVWGVRTGKQRCVVLDDLVYITFMQTSLISNYLSFHESELLPQAFNLKLMQLSDFLILQKLNTLMIFVLFLCFSPILQCSILVCLVCSLYQVSMDQIICCMYTIPQSHCMLQISKTLNSRSSFNNPNMCIVFLTSICTSHFRITEGRPRIESLMCLKHTIWMWKSVHMTNRLVHWDKIQRTYLTPTSTSTGKVSSHRTQHKMEPSD